MTYGGQESIAACEDIIKICNKQIEKVEKEINQWKQNKEDFQLSVSFKYKDFEIKTYEDIDDLIANDYITASQHEKLYNKLMDLRKTSDIDYKIRVLEHKLMYWKYFRSNMVNTKECEEERL